MKRMKLSLLFIVLCTCIIHCHEAVAADTGALEIGNIVSSTSWTNFTVAYLQGSENNRATTSSTGTGNAGVGNQFGFSIPSTSTIDGVEVQV